MNLKESQKSGLLKDGLLWILILGLALRLLAGFWQQESYWQVGDISYFQIAENLLRNHAYAMSGYTFWRGPVFPAYLALFARVFQHNTAAFITANGLLSSAVILASYWLAAEIFDRKTGLAAAALVAVYPYLVWQGSHIIENSMVSLLLLLFILGVVKLERGYSTRLALVTGILLGLAYLAKSITIAILPFTLIWWLAKPGSSWTRQLRRFGPVVLSLGVVAAPWIVRNSLTCGQLVLTESNSGVNLWKGNNPLTLAVYPQHSLDSLAAYRGEKMTMPQNASECQASELYQSAALDYIRSHPAGFGRAFAIKAMALYDWRFVPRANTNAVLDPETGAVLQAGGERSQPEHLLYSLPYLACLGLAVGGLWFIRTCPKRELLLFLLVFLAWTLVHGVVFAYTRYRMQLEPFLLILAAQGLVGGMGRMGLKPGILPGRGKARWQPGARISWRVW